MTNDTATLNAPKLFATLSELNQSVEEDFSPNPNLLPFGGFDVAVLLSKLHDSAVGGDRQNQTVSFLPAQSDRSGYLRSKLAGAQIGF